MLVEKDEIAALSMATFDGLRVLVEGAKKYPPGNFRKVSSLDHAEAARRHVTAWANGLRLDPETGLPSLAHAFVRIAMAMAVEAWADEKRPATSNDTAEDCLEAVDG
jgi:hypothetical protein